MCSLAESGAGRAAELCEDAERGGGRQEGVLWGKGYGERAGLGFLSDDDYDSVDDYLIALALVTSCPWGSSLNICTIQNENSRNFVETTMTLLPQTLAQGEDCLIIFRARSLRANTMRDWKVTALVLFFLFTLSIRYEANVINSDPRGLRCLCEALDNKIWLYYFNVACAHPKVFDFGPVREAPVVHMV